MTLGGVGGGEEERPVRGSEGGLRLTNGWLLPEAESIFPVTAWVKNASYMLSRKVDCLVVNFR